MEARKVSEVISTETYIRIMLIKLKIPHYTFYAYLLREYVKI